jgi:predicted nucleic acid-binding protein
MIILDTSIWIEHLKKNLHFFTKISKLLESREILAVECVFGELLQGIKSNSKIWTMDKKFLKIIPEELIYIE